MVATDPRSVVRIGSVMPGTDRLSIRSWESRLFGLSLSKLLFTIFIVIAVWKGFALVTRLARERRAGAVKKKPSSGARGKGKQTVELIECSRCGAYFDPEHGCRCGLRQG